MNIKWLFFIYDYISNNLPISFIMNKEVPNSRTTRQSNLLHMQRCNSNFATTLPLFSLPVIWKKWSKLFQYINSRTNFKRCLRIKMINNNLDEVRCNYNHCIECQNELSKLNTNLSCTNIYYIFYSYTCLDFFCHVYF